MVSRTHALEMMLIFFFDPGNAIAWKGAVDVIVGNFISLMDSIEELLKDAQRAILLISNKEGKSKY